MLILLTEIESHEHFAQVGLEPPSSQLPLSEFLGLYMLATTQLDVCSYCEGCKRVKEAGRAEEDPGKVWIYLKSTLSPIP
jgi:hypothetical protein